MCACVHVYVCLHVYVYADAYSYVSVDLCQCQDACLVRSCMCVCETFCSMLTLMLTLVLTMAGQLWSVLGWCWFQGGRVAGSGARWVDQVVGRCCVGEGVPVRDSQRIRIVTISSTRIETFHSFP